jgi:hypothetical protein
LFGKNLYLSSNLKRIMAALRLICIVFFAWVISCDLTAQPAKCGTIVTPQVVAQELAMMDSTHKMMQYPPNRCFGKTLSITAHITKDSLGGVGVTEAAILATVQNLNNLFAPICISFEVCKFNYIDNYKYDEFRRPDDEAEFLTLYTVPKTINIVYARTVCRTPPTLVGGYAYFPGGPDFIAISKGSLSAIYHEMGHFFGLYHTFEDQFGLELVNGSNCITAGDLVCDTPADPGLGNTAAPDCQLSPYTKDTNNEWYVPHIGNIMSYYSSDCTCGLFTTQQYNRMAMMYQNFRFYLW